MRLALGLVAAAALLALEGCGPPPVTTRKPMFVGDTANLKPGLWAVLGVKCPAPVNADAAKWPICAAPVMIGKHDLTFFGENGQPIKIGLVASNGVPIILQFELHYRDKLVDVLPSGTGGKRAFLYVSFTPESTDPVATSGWLRGLWCSKDPYPGIETSMKKPDVLVGCTARSIEALRGMARDRVGNVEPQRTVWIADAPTSLPVPAAK